MLTEKFANNDKSSGESTSSLHDVDFQSSRDIFSSRKVQDQSLKTDSNVLSFGTKHLYGDNKTGNGLSDKSKDTPGAESQQFKQDLQKIEQELASLMTWLEQRGVKLPPK
jgi:hypothetical protein